MLVRTQVGVGRGNGGRKPPREGTGIWSSPQTWGFSPNEREVSLPQTQEMDPASQTLTEAEEEGVHAHAVHAEEPVGDEVGTHDHRLEEKLRGHATTSHLQRVPSPGPAAGRGETC